MNRTAPEVGFALVGSFPFLAVPSAGLGYVLYLLEATRLMEQTGLEGSTKDGWRNIFLTDRFQQSLSIERMCRALVR